MLLSKDTYEVMLKEGLKKSFVTYTMVNMEKKTLFDKKNACFFLFLPDMFKLL